MIPVLLLPPLGEEVGTGPVVQGSKVAPMRSHDPQRAGLLGPRHPAPEGQVEWQEAAAEEKEKVGKGFHSR